MKLYKVTMEMWRETWNGSDQCDNREHIEFIKASSATVACNKGSRKALAPYKDGCSHYIWVQNIEAEVITTREARALRKAMRGPRRKKPLPTLCKR